MKILFLVHDYVVDPLGIGYLSAALKNAGHETCIWKTGGGGTECVIKSWEPDILAYSVTTGWHNYYLGLNLELKRKFPKVISIFGGPHATFFPEIANEKGVDFVVQGEAEKTFVDLMVRIKNLGWPPLNCYSRTVEPGKLEQNLDNIVFPDRDLMYSYPENRKNPVKNVMLSRGCPFACSYCYNGIYKKMYHSQKTLRYRSVSNVIDECVKLVKDYPETKFIFFQDDEFIMDKQRLDDFAYQYVSRVKLPFHCQVRAELMTREKAYTLSWAGCKSVTFAIESGNENIRRNMLKRKVSNEQILNCCDALKRYGIKYRAENMIGLPGETLDEALETLDLNIKCRAAVAWCSLFQPYPKTKLGDMCEEMLLYDGDVDKIGNDFFKYSVLKRDTVKEFNNLQKLFIFVVKWPFLRPFVRFLIKMPEFKILHWLSIKFKQRMYDKELYKI